MMPLALILCLWVLSSSFRQINVVAQLRVKTKRILRECFKILGNVLICLLFAFLLGVG